MLGTLTLQTLQYTTAAVYTVLWWE